MSATEELRRLLDERGVKYRVWDGVHPITVWHDEWFSYEYMERTLLNGAKPHTGEVVDGSGRLEAVIHVCTPEQAVAATLGPGTCSIDVFDNLMESEGAGDVWLECSSCHWKMDYAEAPSMPLNYCPNCGARVVSGDGEE